VQSDELTQSQTPIVEHPWFVGELDGPIFIAVAVFPFASWTHTFELLQVCFCETGVNDCEAKEHSLDA